MRSKQLITLAFLSIFIFVGSINLYPRLVWNTSSLAFESKEETSSEQSISLSTPYTIRELIIISAGHFLKGQKYIFDLSEKIELSDINSVDFLAIQSNIDNALDTIFKAWHYYQQLELKANNTPYNNFIIEKLATFDYDSFKAQHGLVNEIFTDVSSYLVIGDIRGVYARATVGMEKLYSILQDVKLTLQLGKIPSNSTMWDLNQECAKVLLFGQYVARIFETLK